MIKITFEVSDDFIKEKADIKSLNLESSSIEITKSLADVFSFRKLEELLHEGKTELLVTLDKLDDKSIEIYNGTIGQICALAVFSETDKKEDK